MSENIKIMIIEDEGIIAQDIEDMIREMGYESAGIFYSSDKAIDFLSFNQPDLILCDINIKGPKDGIEVSLLAQKKRRTPVIFLTSMSDKATLQRAKQVLPYGYIIKPFDERDLMAAIEIALFKFSQELDALSLSKTKVDKLASQDLTDKEWLILSDFTQGLNNPQILDKHRISINTLKYHSKNIFSKLDVNSRSEALHKIISLLTGQQAR